MVKRTGPLVAVVPAAADPDLAERLLGGIRYQAEITRNEYVPTERDNMGDLLLNICILTGILAAFAWYRDCFGVACGTCCGWSVRAKSRKP